MKDVTPETGGRRHMRRPAFAAGSMLSALALSCAGLLSMHPASAATGFHYPGTPGSADHSFAYLSGVRGEPSPSKALTHFLRTGSDGLHLPLSKWTHLSKNLFVYSGTDGNIRVTTYRLPKGSYVVTQADQTCATF
jgi:hypothetical protein